MTSIGHRAFASCSSLTSITIPSSVLSIGEWAFYYCDSLKSIDIPSSVSSIGDYAFSRCSSLTSVNIPSSVSEIGKYTFYDCSSDLIIYGEAGSYAEKYAKENEMKIHLHTYQQTITKATTKKNGTIVNKCSACGSIKSTTDIYAASSIKLSKTSFTYNGKNKKPTVIIKDNKGNKLPADSYKITYPKNSKKVGKYTVTITLQGNYSGTVELTYRIMPKGTSISKLTAKKKGFTAKWKKQTGQTTGYQLQYSTSKKFKGAKTTTVKKNKTISKSIKKLKSGKKYYVRIRTYKTVKIKGKNLKICSGWSKVKSVKTKK